MCVCGGRRGYVLVCLCGVCTICVYVSCLCMCVYYMCWVPVWWVYVCLGMSVCGYVNIFCVLYVRIYLYVCK